MGKKVMEIQSNVIAWAGFELLLIMCQAVLPNLSGVDETSQSWAVQRVEREKSEENCLKLSPVRAELKLPANWKEKKTSFINDWV